MLQKALLALVLVAMVQKAHMASSIDSALTKSLRLKGTATIFLTMKERTSSVLGEISISQFATRAARLNTVADSLRQHAQRTQDNVLAYLRQEPNKFQSFWITNQIVVHDADLKLVEKLAQFPEVFSIAEELVIPIEDPLDLVMYEDLTAATPNEVQWGVSKIQADQVWSMGIEGEGIVVATVDSGVRVTHEALKDNYRADYGWFDPDKGTTTPNDDDGHGTHTMGTIAGTARGIGVAPKAQWIACKGCGQSKCSQSTLVACGQFMACPTKADGSSPDCSKAPHLVSNSWGGGRGREFYADVIDAWRAGNILPFFSIGNFGPACNTANSPGDNENVIGVGSTTKEDELSDFSSVGPTLVGSRIKPDISAPGSEVLSASHTSDSAYVLKSGTSMACPHAAGAAALVLSANSRLSYDQVKSVLEEGCEAIKSEGKTCAGIPDTQYPNHHAGAGRINALRSVSAVRNVPAPSDEALECSQ